MPKHKKVGKERLDKYYRLAKESGFRSRAAFKLVQLNKKYDFLGSAQAVVDLCAAPGGWLQVARKYQPIAGVTIGVDLATIKSIPGVTTFVGDITTQKTLTRIKQELKSLKADAVLHDGAPNVGANWFKDSYTQSELVVAALKIAVNVLRPGGVFITKVFRGKDYTSLMWVLNQFFNKVEATKPKASREASAEVFAACLGFKAPKEIDPKLLNPAYIFEEVSEQTTLKKIAPKELQKHRNKNREGYAEEMPGGVIFKSLPVTQFLESDTPIALLVEYNELKFDENSQMFLNHPATNKEIRKLCEDLKVLGMIDFKVLLKWRLAMRKFKDEQEMGDDDDDEEGEEDIKPILKLQELKEQELKRANNTPADEEIIKKELAELKQKAEKVKKNLMKRAKLKVAKRPPLPQTEKAEDVLDNLPDKELFSLSGMGKEEFMNATRGAQETEDADEYVNLVERDEEEAAIGNMQKVVNPDDYSDEEDMYEDMVDIQLEKMYEKYLEGKSKRHRKYLRDAVESSKKQKEDLYKALLEEHEELKKKINFEDASNPLVVNFADSVPSSRKASQWFSQNVFDILRDEQQVANDAAAVKKSLKRGKDDEDSQAAKKRKGDDGKASRVDNDNSDDDSSDDDDDKKNQDSDDDDDDGESSDDEFYEKLKQKLADAQLEDGIAAVSGEKDIETVPREMHDEETRAETLAMAKRLLDKKARRDFIDSAFHRYAFNDDNLPDWFVNQEKPFLQKENPFTKEEIERIKAQFAVINQTPVKKVLEAKMRKQRQNQIKIKTLKAKANEIAESQDMSNSDKARMLSKIYNQQKNVGKKRKIVVVTTKAGNGATRKKAAKGTTLKYVDPHMKKEKRAKSRAEKRKRS